MRTVALLTVILAVCTGSARGTGYDFLNVGIDYYNQERYADAVIWLDKAIAAGDLVPDQQHVALVDRGVSHAALGHNDPAIADFTAALAIQPDEMLVLANRSFAYVAAGQPDKALEDLSLLQKKKPNDDLIGFQAGLVNWQLGRYKAAAASFTPAAENDGNPYAWLWLQLANVKLGQPITPFHLNNYAVAGVHIRKADPRYVWPGPILSLFAGEKGEDSVITAVKTQGNSEGAACEANFYLAEWRKLHGDAEGAAPLMARAAAECPNGYIELPMAKFEMRKTP